MRPLNSPPLRTNQDFLWFVQSTSINLLALSSSPKNLYRRISGEDFAASHKLQATHLRSRFRTLLRCFNLPVCWHHPGWYSFVAIQLLTARSLLAEAVSKPSHWSNGKRIRDRTMIFSCRKEKKFWNAGVVYILWFLTKLLLIGSSVPVSNSGFRQRTRFGIHAQVNGWSVCILRRSPSTTSRVIDRLGWPRLS